MLEAVRAFADIIYELVGIDEEEQEDIQIRMYDKAQRIKRIIKKAES